MNIADRVAVVSGGASGLGEGTVRSLTRAGARVALLDLDSERGESLAGELGENVVFIETNVAEETSVEQALKKTVDRWGGLSVAVSCAGVGWPALVLGREGPMSNDFFNKIVSINLIGTMNLIRLAAYHMARAEPNEDGERGVIINTSSAAAFEGPMSMAAYAATKAAVAGMTLPIAREMARHGIRVVSIAPGHFETPMHFKIPEPIRKGQLESLIFPDRPGYPSEFAALVAHIVENPMLNGETIRLDGAVRLLPK